jgi:hypothetical protein
MRCKLGTVAIGDGPPPFLARLVGDAVQDEGYENKVTDAGCCLRATSRALGTESCSSGVPDWVFYGPDSLLAECGPVVSWFGSRGLEVSVLAATSPDY